MERIDDLEGKGRHYEHPVTGHKMPSVTNVLSVLAKPALVPWAAKIERELVLETARTVFAGLNGQTIDADGFRARLESALPRKKAHALTLESAGDIGTEAHAVVEWRVLREMGIATGEEPNASEPALWSVAAWEDFRKEFSFRPTHAEVRLYSEELDAAGATDGICCELETHMLAPTKRKISALWDLKTSKAIWPEMEIQVATYRHMAIERGYLDDKSWGLIVRLPKTLADSKFEYRLIPPPRCKELVDVFRAARRIWTWLNADKETKRP